MSYENGNANAHTHDHGHEEGAVIVTTDEDGKQHYFELLDSLEVDDQLYGLLLYLGDEEKQEGGGDDAADKSSDDEDGYSEEFVIMKIVQEANGDHVFESIEDDEEFERILAIVERLADEDDDLEAAD
ncbi:MAG: DUF1292 domain-containing protein [Cyanobacteria bacterium HKST-UBA04]|nr:DUF1292 domain-containing protein [Cyanobacteria bacterium HKST-UBA04]